MPSAGASPLNGQRRLVSLGMLVAPKIPAVTPAPSIRLIDSGGLTA
ncbi:hypothetical protein [Cyanobium sp. Cruz CV11-17]|nr:hypothetical protein [Cyanobium sp. Cruz CV11-17]